MVASQTQMDLCVIKISLMRYHVCFLFMCSTKWSQVQYIWTHTLSKASERQMQSLEEHTHTQPIETATKTRREESKEKGEEETAAEQEGQAGHLIDTKASPQMRQGTCASLDPGDAATHSSRKRRRRRRSSSRSSSMSYFLMSITKDRK